MTNCSASAAARLFNSSLYFVAALLVYLTLVSLLARAAEPPCDWKYLVADSFPPSFMIRSCSHCHSAPKQISTNAQTISLFASGGVYTYGRGLWSGQRRCGHPDSDGWMNSQGTSKYRKEPKTKWDSWNRNRSISISSKVSTLPCSGTDRGWEGHRRTLFAGFSLSFSKTF